MAQHNPSSQTMSPNDNHYSIVPDHISMQQYNPATQSQYPPAPDQTCNLQRDIARAVELINKLQSRDRVPDDKLQKLKEVYHHSISFRLDHS